MSGGALIDLVAKGAQDVTLPVLQKYHSSDRTLNAIQILL